MEGPSPEIVELVTDTADWMVRCNSSLRDERDDLIQEALLGLWLAGVNEPGGLAAVIARRRMIDWLRVQRGPIGSVRIQARNAQVSIDQVLERDGDITLGDTVASEPDTYGYIDAAEFRARAKKLSKRHQEVIALRLKGLTLAQIGWRWGVSEARACQVLNDARHALIHDGCTVTLIQCRKNQKRKETG